MATKKVYTQDAKGGIAFSSERKSGEVRIPNYVYDLWLPLLGVEAIGVYSVYCRLEREGLVAGVSIKDIAGACRVGDRRLTQINSTLEELGFIQSRKPSGSDRLKHYTTEIVVLDAPQSIPSAVIEKYQKPSGYEPLSHWLVNRQMTTPEASNDDMRIVNQRLDASPNDDTKVASLSLQPLEVATSIVEKDSAPSGAIEQAINQLPLDDLPTAEHSTSPQPPDDMPQPQAKKLSEGKSVDALLKAYLDASGTIQPTIYRNKTIRGQALEMHRRGITPGHIQFFIEDLRRDEFWRGKQIRWDKVAGELFPWLRAKPRIKEIIEPAEPLPVLFDENSPPSDYTGLDLEADLLALAAKKDMSTWLS